MADGSYVGLSRRAGRSTGLDRTGEGALMDTNKEIFSGELLQKPEAAQIATLEAKYGNADKEIDNK